MLLTLTTTHQPATELGFVLVKHPDKLREVDLSTGKAYVFFPEATEKRCTAALLVDIDSVSLTRRGENPSLADYVSDRPYAASSFMAVALSKVFRSAMGGVCKDKPGLATTPFPLEIRITALPCRGGEAMVRRLFEPLGYTVTPAKQLLVDDQFPTWGYASYLDVELTHPGVLVKDALLHLYVLIPVLDDDKHYYVGDDEVKKLIGHGTGWLDKHPMRELITRRYLGGKGQLVRDAQEQMGPVAVDEEEEADDAAVKEAQVEAKLSLNKQRINFVVETLTAFGDAVKSVVDLGCGEGKLLVALATLQPPRYTPGFGKLAGLDVALRPLQIAKWKLRKTLRSAVPYSTSGSPDAFVQLYHGAATYRDARIEGFDAVTATEVIEHLDPYRLAMFEKVVFGRVKPKCVVVTTPNVEYNCLVGNSPVSVLKKGRIPIRKLVKATYNGLVTCVDEQTQKLSSAPVIGWLKKPGRPWCDWLRICVRGKETVRLTKEHEVLTPAGRKRADALRVGDRVITERTQLSPQQKALIYGSLLGDASVCLGKSYRSPHFKVGHCQAQKPFLLWKMAILGKAMAPCKPFRSICTKGFSRYTVMWTGHTKSDPRLHDVREACLDRHGNKRLSNSWVSQLTHAAISVWFCDDGSCDSEVGYSANFCVPALKPRILLLMQYMKTQGWPVKLRYHGRRKQNLYLVVGERKGWLRGKRASPGVDRFWRDVTPYIPHCMRYKVPHLYRDIPENGFWKERPQMPLWADVVTSIRPLARTRPKTVKTQKGWAQFCLTVKGHGNFFVGGIAVGNCLFPDIKTRFRHRDHQFEWTRAEFFEWCWRIREKYGYAFTLSGIGTADDKLGPPTQAATFVRG